MDSNKFVYEAIDSERQYQNTKWTELDKKNTLGDFLTFMQQQFDKAKSSYGGPGRFEKETLEAIRKTVAVGVAAMEKFGAPKREGF